jgi:hypothetical protein
MAKSAKTTKSTVAGFPAFDRVMRGLIQVPKKELDREIAKYKKKRAAKKDKKK